MDNQRTVLAVDDENDVLLLIKTALQAEGYRVLTSPDGEDALATACSERPDLILLDVMMSGMDGFQVLEELRRNETTCTIPVVMVTVIAERDRKRWALEHGVKYYIVKPFDLQDLTSKVHSAIDDTEHDMF